MQTKFGFSNLPPNPCWGANSFQHRLTVPDHKYLKISEDQAEKTGLKKTTAFWILFKTLFVFYGQVAFCMVSFYKSYNSS